jgi:hypothetical protein
MGSFASTQREKQPWELEQPKTDEDRLKKARRYFGNENYADAYMILMEMDAKKNSDNKIYKDLMRDVRQKLGLE